MGMTRSAVVVGAGIGGLTAALVLARAGFKVNIYEQAHRLDPVGAGLQLAPNAMHILDGLGLVPALRKTAVESESILIRKGDSARRIGGMDQGAFAMQRWGAPFFVIHRGDLQMTLLEAAYKEANITLTLGRRLEDIRSTPDHVTAVFSKYGDEIEVEAALLIAADGIWSRARAHVGLTAPANFSGCVAWRTVIPADIAPEAARIPRTNLWLHPGGHVVHYPIRDGKEINIVAVLEDSWRERGWSEAGDVAWINRRFREWHPEIRDLVGLADTWLRWSLFDRAPDWKWTRGPVALLGDAAHPMVPFLAQGAAQAIEDAGVLGQCLAETDDFAKALKMYEDHRLRRAAKVQRLSRRQMRIYHSSGPVAMARDLAMGLMGTSGMARTMDWLYGHRI